MHHTTDQHHHNITVSNSLQVLPFSKVVWPTATNKDYAAYMPALASGCFPSSRRPSPCMAEHTGRLRELLRNSCSAQKARCLLLSKQFLKLSFTFSTYINIHYSFPHAEFGGFCDIPLGQSAPKSAVRIPSFGQFHALTYRYDPQQTERPRSSTTQTRNEQKLK